MELKDEIMARMYVVITLISLLPILIAMQVLRVTTLDGPRLRTTAEAQSTEFEVIPAIRGEIFDAGDRPLVVNIERLDIDLDPSIEGFSRQAEAFYRKLSTIINLPVAVIRSRVDGRSSPSFVTLAQDVHLSSDELDWLGKVPGAIARHSTSRRYNQGEAAAHVLGVAGIDAGQSGLELQFDAEMRGVDGRRAVHLDRKNVPRFIPGSEEILPTHGESLYLTVDLIMQSILEEELKKGAIIDGARWASAVALDPNTGAILAMANYPTFNPNNPGRYNHNEKRNRAITDKIEPGSVIKILPAVAALESRVVALSDTIDTGNGELVQGRYTLRDTHPNGRIPFWQVIQKSSNIGTALVAERMDNGVLYSYARQFGFNQKTGIELPGEVATTLKKLENWTGSTRSAMSRGYAIEASTLQIALSYAALANGGVLMKPYLVRERRDSYGNVIWRAHPDSIRRVFKRDTAKKLVPVFESVISEEGTAPMAMVEGLRIAGKTGTAQKSRPDGRGFMQGKYRATFVGFYPVENPQIVLAIVMDEPTKSSYGGIVAAPVFKAVAKRWMARMPELARYVHVEGWQEIEESMAVVPDVADLPVPIAGRLLTALGLNTPATGSNYRASVITQNLAAGREVLSGVPVELTVSVDSTGVMPDVTGLAGRDARSWLAALKIEVKFDGHGTVRSQSVAAGGELPQEVTLILN